MIRYPIFLKLSGRRVVIIGGGIVAARKAQAILATGAELVVVAETIDDTLIAFCKDANAELKECSYSKDYLSGAVLAIAATSDHELNKQIYKDCQELGLLCNVVDIPQLCDFFVPAVVKRGDLQIAVSTEGSCPAYAGYLRKKLEQIFTDEHARFLTELKAIRKLIIEDVPDPAGRKRLLERLVDDKSFEFFLQNGSDQWKAYVANLIQDVS